MPLPSGAVILQVVPSLGSGGVERGTIEMVQAIARAGGRPLVASAGGRLEPAVVDAGGRHLMLPLASKNPMRIWRNVGGLARLIRAEGVQLVHARSRAPAWSASLAATRTGTRFLTTYHAPYDESTPGKRAYNAVMARGERVIAISNFIAELVHERHGTPTSRIRLIPRGVDPALFDPDTLDRRRIEALRTAWHIGGHQKVVLLPGRLSRWKGQEVLIQALRWLRTPGLVCVIAGPLRDRDRYVAQLQARAKALGVESRVRFVGACDDMPAGLALADIVVNASVEPEGFGRTVIEAQAMRRPIVATDHGGAAETVEHGVTGWRVTPGDPVALAAAIDRVLALPASERAAVGAAARQAVLARYTTAAMQRATLAVYRELLGVNILVIKLGALGDFVQAFEPFAAIRARHAADRVTLLTTAPFAELAERSPWFDRVRVDARPGWWNLPALLRLRRMLQGYDFVYDLQTSGRSSRYFLLAGRPPWSGIARGASHPHTNPARDRMHNHDRQREQLVLAGVGVFPPADLSWLTGGGPALSEPYVLLAPGCSPHLPEKRWPTERFGAFARLIAARGVLPVVIGTTSEGDLGVSIRAACPEAIDLTGQTSLFDLGGLAARASLAVGNDTGPIHLAAAVGCPCIALFSARSNPGHAAPRGPVPGTVTVLREANLADLALERVAACLP